MCGLFSLGAKLFTLLTPRLIKPALDAYVGRAGGEDVGRGGADPEGMITSCRRQFTPLLVA